MAKFLNTDWKVVVNGVDLSNHADDIDTPPQHSQRVFDALSGPKQLILVPGAHHGGALRATPSPIAPRTPTRA